MPKRTRVSFTDYQPRSYSNSFVSKTGPSQESFKVTSKSTTLSAKNLGLSRVWNVIAPPFKVKQKNYFPRVGTFVGGETSGNNSSNVTELTQIQAAAGSQSMHQIPHLSCFEWKILANKCIDNFQLANPAEQPVSYMSPQFNPDQYLMVEKCSYKYNFENAQTFDAFVEIIEVQPRMPIMDQLLVSPPQHVTSVANLTGTTPLDTMFRDHQALKTIGNARYPQDSLFVTDKATTEAFVGYSTRGAIFHKHYKVLKKRVFKLGGGSRITYEMSIPGFKSKSHFNVDELKFSLNTQGGGLYDFSIQPSMWEHSRWLLVRTWSGYVNSAADSTKIGMGDTKIKVICSRNIVIRPVPAVSKAILYPNYQKGTDAFGTRETGTTAILSVADANVRVIDEEDNEMEVAGQV
jgi:hypothetical protein